MYIRKDDHLVHVLSYYIISRPTNANERYSTGICLYNQRWV